MATGRSTIDSDVERALDLLGHYQDALLHAQTSPSEHDESVLTQLEELLRRWLPCAADAHPLIGAILQSLAGTRMLALERLRGIQFHPLRLACLQELMEAQVNQRIAASSAHAVCSDDIAHWRSTLPFIFRRPDGTSYVSESDHRGAAAESYYWSFDLSSRPSRLGASYSLACACDAAAAAGMKLSLGSDSLRPLLHLAHRLRETPNWVYLERERVAGVLDEQLELVRAVELVLSEIALVAAHPRVAVDAPTANTISTIPTETPRAGNGIGADTPPDQPGADDTQLIGWAEILPVLVLPAKDRSARERVIRLNESMNGPIAKVGRKPIANRGLLMRWWRSLSQRANDAAKDQADQDRNTRAQSQHLSNHGVRKDEGYQLKDTPHTRRNS